VSRFGALLPELFRSFFKFVLGENTMLKRMLLLVIVLSMLVGAMSVASAQERRFGDDHPVGMVI